MIPALAYARALSLPGGGWKRWGVEAVAVVGAASAFSSSSSVLPIGISVFGGAYFAHLPVLNAQGGAPSAGGRLRQIAHPSLPLTAMDRVIAVAGLCALRMLPAAAVMVAFRAEPTVVAVRLVAAVGLLVVWLAGQRLAEVRGGEGSKWLAYLVLLGSALLPVSTVPWALLPAVLALLVLRIVDPMPGAPSGQAAVPTTYRAHRLDSGADPRPMFSAAMSDAANLGAGDGLLAGLVLVVLAAGHTVLLGFDPAGDLEELRAAMVWGLSGPVAWPVVFPFLGLVALRGFVRSAVLPGHGSDPTARATALAPLRWLPIRRSKVWLGTGWVSAVGWTMTWAGAMAIIGLVTRRMGSGHEAWLGLLSLSTLATGLTAGLVYARFGPLQAYETGRRPASAVPLLAAIAVLVLPGFLWQGVAVGAVFFAEPFTLVLMHGAYLALNLAVLGAVIVWFRALALREPAPVP